MAKKGRKPALKIATPKAKPANKCPPPPRCLSRYAKAEWKRVAPRLWEAGRFSVEVQSLFESYCCSVGIARESNETLQKDGLVIATEFGPKRHPSVAILSTAMSHTRMLASKLGLTDHREENKEAVDNGWSEELLA